MKSLNNDCRCELTRNYSELQHSVPTCSPSHSIFFRIYSDSDGQL